MKNFFKPAKKILLSNKARPQNLQAQALSDSAYGQEGVTLLLAILVLSSVLAISFSIATVLFIEIRSSGDLLRTEPAWYGAETLKEEVLFKYKRKVENVYYTTQTNDNKVALTSTSSLVSDVAFQDVVPPTSGTFGQSTNRYAIYDVNAEDPQAGSGYGRIKVTFLSTGNTGYLYIYLCQYDPNKAYDPGGTEPEVYTTPPCTDPGDHIYWLVRGQPPYRSEEVFSYELDSSLQQELILVNGSGQNIYVKIEGFGPGPDYVPTGIPYANQTVVDINASNSGVNRRVRTYIPNF